MRKIGIHIEKGGSGKTTTAGNVGFELSSAGGRSWSTAIPQGNLSSWYVTSAVSI